MRLKYAAQHGITPIFWIILPKIYSKIVFIFSEYFFFYVKRLSRPLLAGVQSRYFRVFFGEAEARPS